jgi:capsule polysaccharide export protein KpsE/RkpR
MSIVKKATLNYIKNAESDAEIIISKKSFFAVKEQNENLLKTLEMKLKEQIALTQLSEKKIEAAVKGFTNAKDKIDQYKSQVNSSNIEIEALKGQIESMKKQLDIHNGRQKFQGEAINKPYKLDDDTLKNGADDLFNKKYKKEVEEFAKQFEL